jgi:ribosomal protein L44E
MNDMRVIWKCTECNERVSDNKKEGDESFPPSSVTSWCKFCQKFTRQITV